MIKLGIKLFKTTITEIKRRVKTQECRNCISFKIVKRYEPWPWRSYDWTCKLGPYPPAEQCANYNRKRWKIFRSKGVSV